MKLQFHQLQAIKVSERKFLINCRQLEQHRYHILIENNNQVTSIN